LADLGGQAAWNNQGVWLTPTEFALVGKARTATLLEDEEWPFDVFAAHFDGKP